MVRRSSTRRKRDLRHSHLTPAKYPSTLPHDALKSAQIDFALSIRVVLVVKVSALFIPAISAIAHAIQPGSHVASTEAVEYKAEIPSELVSDIVGILDDARESQDFMPVRVASDQSVGKR
jgi:hypothetical protein